MDERHFDAIVVGSGFGGAVMAYRLAKGGRRVCLLERGRAYPPGSFPRSPYRMRSNFWVPAEKLYGLYDFWSFHRIHALVASGLGGGSLIYANVLMRKDERWFVKEDLGQAGHEYWPVTRADLDPHYDAVERMLRPQPYPFDHEPYAGTSKTKAFHEAARGLGFTPLLPGLAITFANQGQDPVPAQPIRDEHDNLHGKTRWTCQLCGECDIGCNYGSKNTLDFNYLSAAKRLGANLRTGCEVRALEPRAGGGYAVQYLKHPIGEHADDELASSRTVTCDRLILAAGAIGSTHLLLRNRAAFPRISGALGTRFCGNGDLLTFAVKATKGAGGQRTPRVVDPGHGPVITSAVRVDDVVDGGQGRGFYLEDAGFPEHLAWMLQMFATVRPLGRLAKRRFLWNWFGKGPDPDLSSEVSALFGDTGLSAGVLPLLGIGRDVADGNMRLRAGRLAVDWKKRKSGPYFDRVRTTSRAFAHELGATFVDDPLWYLNRLITVHPLGGCPMGRNPREGVVDARGEVFGYPGLYVADGAVMPGPVGTNPSLTIAAPADRFAGRTAGDREAAGVSPPSGHASGLRFKEFMTGHVTFGERQQSLGARLGRASGTRLSLSVTVEVTDLRAFSSDPGHEVEIDGYVWCEALGGRLQLERGTFGLFPGDSPRPLMRYRAFFTDAVGHPLTLSGVKITPGRPGLRVWRDTTTLYTRVLWGHVEDGHGDDPAAEIVASGILRLRPLDFLRQLASFRADGPTLTARIATVGRFGGFFLVHLWGVYGPGRLPTNPQQGADRTMED